MATPIDTGYYYALPPKVSFDWLSKGWALFSRKPGLWAVVTLILALIWSAGYACILIPSMRNHASGVQSQTSFNPLVILMSSFYGPSLGGFALRAAESVTFAALQFIIGACMCRVALKQIRGENISVSDAFSIGDVFPQLLGTAILYSTIATVCYYALCFPFFIAHGLLMFAPFAVVDRKLGPVEALKFSYRTLKSQWLMAVAYCFVAEFFAGIGICGLIIGLLVTVPTYVLSIAVGYESLAPPPATAPSGPYYGATAPGTWPPAPNPDMEQQTGDRQPFGEEGH
jgi:uncharacterized membrane protein